MTIAPWLCRLGHVATTAQLRASRITHSTLSVALRDGAIERIVRGTFACAHLNGRMRDAAHSRTLIDCVSALDAHADVWSGILRTGLYVRAEPGRHIGALPEGAVVHWSARHEEQTFDLEVAPVDALLSVMRCLDPYDVIACIESALHLGYLNEQEFKQLRDLARHSRHDSADAGRVSPLHNCTDLSKHAGPCRPSAASRADSVQRGNASR